MPARASMRDLRNRTREVVERAKTEPVTITDAGVPIAVLTALPSSGGAWDVDTWLDQVTGPDWASYDSGLLDDLAATRREPDEPDAVERLGLA